MKFKSISICIFTLLLSFGAFGFPIESMLIIGASVSDDHSAKSPGRMIAESVGLRKGRELVIRAKDGAKSTYHDKLIRKELGGLNPDYIVAIDLFFHDFRFSTNPSAAQLNRLEEYITLMSQNAREVYLGTAVDFLYLGGPEIANKRMRKVAKKLGNVFVFELDAIFKKIHSNEGYEYNLGDQKFTVWRQHVMADIIHPNKRGSTIVANLIIDDLRNRYELEDQELPFLKITPP